MTSRTRIQAQTISYSFRVAASRLRPLKLLRYYFDKFPLLSSKRLDYLDWCLIQDKWNNEPRSHDLLNYCQLIRSGMNSKRTVFNWDHLDNL